MSDPAILQVEVMATPVVVLFIVFTVFSIRRSRRRRAEAFRAGDCWVRWQYQPDEWERFLQAEWERSKARIRKLALWFGAAGLLGGVVPGALDGDIAAGLRVGTSFMLLCGGLLPALLLLGARGTLRRGLQSEAEAVVGPDGAYYGGRFFSWRTLGIRGVKVSPGPPAVLQFELHGRQLMGEPPTVRVPVPAGREDEAAELRSRFRAQIKAAR